MLLPIIYAVVRRLLDALTVVVRREITKDVELLALRHENAVLRRQVGSIRRTPVARLWLAALSRLRGHEFAARTGTPTNPGGDQPADRADDQRKPQLGPSAHPGRAGTARTSHRIASSTIWHIPHTSGIDPAPRRAGPT